MIEVYYLAFSEHRPASTIATMIPYRSALVGLLLPSIFCQAQELNHLAGGAAPEAENVMEIPWEEFTMPRGHELPSKMDLSPWFPPAGDQSKQASCSGWALGYGLGTYFWNRKVDHRADTTYLADPANTFSPAFIYNLAAKKEGVRDCKVGVQLSEAIQLICDTGICTWMQFPYDTTLAECQRAVPDTVFTGAARHRMSNPVQVDNRNWAQWEYHLSMFEPVVFLASIGPFFEKGFATGGKAPFTWDEEFPTDWSNRVGHIMVCTGYDNTNNDTTFLVLNSWGSNWGERGYMRVPKETLYWACSEAYVLQPGATPRPLPPAEKPRQFDLGRDQRIKGKLKLGEVHAADGIVLRFMGPSPDGKRQMIDFWASDRADDIRSLAVLMGQPTTFQHLGNIYTLTYNGRSWLTRQVRYTLVKEDPQNNELQRHIDTMFTPRVQEAERGK